VQAIVRVPTAGAMDLQQNEMLALEAIFGVDFRQTSYVSPLGCVIALTPSGDADHVAVDLVVSLPPDYPDSIPSIKVIQALFSSPLSSHCQRHVCHHPFQKCRWRIRRASPGLRSPRCAHRSCARPSPAR
jgi:hypothetical protein